PITFVNPKPSGLAAQWTGGNAVLVVGGSQTSGSDVYISVYERGAQGMLPFDQAWLVRGPSPYIDDYSDQQLAGYKTIVLIGYRYNDRAAAWDRLDRWVKSGGSLYVDTGWQYVDPDWNAGPAPAALPVAA